MFGAITIELNKSLCWITVQLIDPFGVPHCGSAQYAVQGRALLRSHPILTGHFSHGVPRLLDPSATCLIGSDYDGISVLQMAANVGTRLPFHSINLIQKLWHFIFRYLT